MTEVTSSDATFRGTAGDAGIFDVVLTLGGAQAPLGILRDGTQVTVLSDPLAAGGRQWVKISAPAGTGWVAAEFLEKQAATSDGGHTSGSGAGTTAPLRPFRSVITMVSSGS